MKTGKAETQGTKPAPQGAPRKSVDEVGVHLILWPTFRGALKKSKRLTKLWRAVPEPKRRAYFIALAGVAMLPPDSENVRDLLPNCYATAPDLTCETLPRLRTRAAAITQPKYTRHLAAGHVADAKISANQLEKISSAEADMRRDIRKALREFEEAAPWPKLVFPRA